MDRLRDRYIRGRSHVRGLKDKAREDGGGFDCEPRGDGEFVSERRLRLPGRLEEDQSGDL